MMLEQATIRFLGRSVYTDQNSVYMDERQYEFLCQLAKPFAQAEYVCFAEDDSPDGQMDHLVPVDESELRLHVNEAWQGGGWLARCDGLRRNRAALVRDSPTVSYTFLPGTFSFLLAPFAFSNSDLNVLYFGKDAQVSARGLKNGQLLNRAQRGLYRFGQQYLLERADLTFVRDPRVTDIQNDSNVRLSKPVSDLVGRLDSIDRPVCASEPIRLLYVGNFRRTKGHRYVVDAAARLNDTASFDIELRLVGTGPTIEETKRQVKSAGLGDRTTFTGYIGDIDSLVSEYRTADVFALPSITEGFPRVLNEAFEAGLPVVATAVGGIPYVVNDREHAMLVPPRDSDALADAITGVVADEHLRNRLVSNGKQIADELAGDPAEQHVSAIQEVAVQ